MRTLGVRLAPDGGNDLDEFKHRMEEATFLAEDAGGPPQDSPTQSRARCHRIPRYLAPDKA
jgi:hypothetical protein